MKIKELNVLEERNCLSFEKGKGKGQDSMGKMGKPNTSIINTTSLQHNFSRHNNPVWLILYKSLNGTDIRSSRIFSSYPGVGNN